MGGGIVPGCDANHRREPVGSGPASQIRMAPKRRLRRIPLVVLGIGVAVAVIAGAVLARERGKQPVIGSVPRQPVSAASPDVPRLAGTDPITGKRVSLAQFAGRLVVINIWASWCPGCNQEAPALERFAASHPGVTVLGIDVNDTVGGARAFYRRYHWHHPSIFDPSGELAGQLALRGLPTTIFLNRGHRPVTEIVGAGTLAEFDAGLRRSSGRA